MNALERKRQTEIIREVNRSGAYTPELFDPHFMHFENEDFMMKLRKVIDDELMLRQRYLFINRTNNRVDTICSHCGHKGKIKHVIKNQATATCEKCGSELTVRNFKYKTCMDTIWKEFIYFSRSTLSNEVIIAYQLRVKRRVEGRHIFAALTIIDDISQVNRYYFDVKSPCRMMTKSWKEEWQYRKSIHHTDSSVWSGTDTDSLITALKRCKPFQYLPTSCIRGSNPVKLVELFCKYPDIEKLDKIGLGRLISEYTLGIATYSSINWRGKTIQKMLKLNKAEIKILQSGRYNSFFELHLMQQLKAVGINIENNTELDAAYRLARELRVNMKPKELFGYAKPSKILSYLEDQRCKHPKKYHSLTGVLSDFVDMLIDMKKLKMDMNRRRIFPKDLDKTHRDIADMVIIEENKEKDEKMAKIAKKLSKFKTTSHGYIVFPATSAMDLVNESKALGHCVKNYIDRYSNEKTNIFLMRKLDNPEQPRYTIEIGNDYRLIQCRGKGNYNIPENEIEAKMALKAFMAKINKGSKGVKHERIAN